MNIDADPDLRADQIGSDLSALSTDATPLLQPLNYKLRLSLQTLYAQCLQVSVLVQIIFTRSETLRKLS